MPPPTHTKCIRVYEHVCMHVNVSYSPRQVLFAWTQSLPIWLIQLARLLWNPVCLPSHHAHLAFSWALRDWNYRPQTCTTGTLNAKLSPGPFNQCFYASYHCTIYCSDESHCVYPFIHQWALFIYFVVIFNSPAMNMGCPSCRLSCVLSSRGHIPRSGTAGSRGKSLFNF